MPRMLFPLALLAALAFSSRVLAQDPATQAAPVGGNGSLTVELRPAGWVKPELRAQSPLEKLTWGVRGNALVIVQTDPEWVTLDLKRTARLGSPETLELPAGHYDITVVALDGPPTADPRRQAKVAFVNERAFSVDIQPGRGSRLEIGAYVAPSGAVRLGATGGVVDAVPDPAVPTRLHFINEREPASVPWRSYRGPLKREGRVR